MHRATRVSTAAIVITVGVALAVTGCGKSKAKKEYEKAMAEMDADVEKMNARMQKEAENQARVQRDVKQREADRLAQVQREREEREQREQQERLERDRQREQEKKEETARLRADAADKFSQVSLSPSVRLSKRAEAYGIQATLQGKDLEKYRQLLAAKDFLSLYKLENDRDDDYVNDTRIDNAVNAVLRKEFYIRINPTRGQIPENLLTLVRLPPADSPGNYYSIANRTCSLFKQHPDGTGVLGTWDGTSRELLLLVSTDPNIIRDGNVHRRVEQIDRAGRDERDALEKKLDLGELTEDQFRQKVQASVQSQHDAYVKLLDVF